MTQLQIQKTAAKVAGFVWAGLRFILELPTLILFGILDFVIGLVKLTPLAGGIVWLAKKFTNTSVGQSYLVVQDAFLDIAEGDGVEKVRAKAAEKTTLFTWYNAVDAVLAGAFGWLIVLLEAFGFSRGTTFAAGIAFDIMAPIPFLVLAYKNGQDLTLATDFRRALDALRSRAPVVWGMALAASIVRGAIWNGPEYVILFFRKEIGGWFRVAVTLVFLATLQALFWGWLWILGYDSVLEPLGEILISLWG